MDGRTGAGPLPPRPWRRWLGVLAGTAMLAAGCGGSHAAGPAAGAARTPGQAMNAYAACVRAHGVQVYASSVSGSPPPPDVPYVGNWTIQGPGTSSLQYQTAAKACRRLMPTGTPPSAADLRQERARALNGAACMRAHGYPAYPDPAEHDGTLSFPPPPAGIDQNSPQFQQVAKTSGALIP